MRYFSYNSLSDDGQETVITVSEEDIRDTYYPYWYYRMCRKLGKQYVDENYCIDDCIEDFVIINWAWEVAP